MPGNNLKKCVAVIRLKNEGQWLPKCLESIEGVFGGIVLATQGEQSDDTYTLCETYAEENDNALHIHYPFELPPNGPDYQDRCLGNRYTRHHFYNWAFDHWVSFPEIEPEWVCKWDGDMLACDNLADTLNPLMDQHHAIKFFGVDLAGDLLHVGHREFCASEPRLYRIKPDSKYVAGSHCETLMLPPGRSIGVVDEPLFFHTKWLKSEESITKAWPENWHTIPHFNNLMQRKEPVRIHGRVLPKCLREPV